MQADMDAELLRLLVVPSLYDAPCALASDDVLVRVAAARAFHGDVSALLVTALIALATGGGDAPGAGPGPPQTRSLAAAALLLRPIPESSVAAALGATAAASMATASSFALAPASAAAASATGPASSAAGGSGLHALPGAADPGPHLRAALAGIAGHVHTPGLLRPACDAQ